MSYQYQNLAATYHDFGRAYNDKKLYKQAYENLKLARKTLEEGLTLVQNVLADNVLWGVYSDKMPEPDPIMIDMFQSELETINIVITECVESMPRAWREKLTKISHPKDEVELDDVIIVPVRPSTPRPIMSPRKNYPLSFFSRTVTSSSSSSNSHASSRPSPQIAAPLQQLAYTPKIA